MRVVVTGATGNVGASVCEALSAEPAVDSILGLARRLPTLDLPKVTWASADVSSSDLEPHFRGADVVVHLAWLIQPSHQPAVLEATNVEGTARVLAAVARTTVPALVYASSVGAYSAGPKDRPVLDTTRARTELGWRPTVGAGEALRELLEGLADGAGGPTPPLARETTVPRRSMPDLLTRQRAHDTITEEEGT